FEDFGSFAAGVVCCPIDWIEYTKAMLLENGISSDSITVISGGKNRNCSVKNGCRFLSENYNITDDDIILTHDAVRPFINSRIIKENISAVNEFGAANTVMPVYDSIIRSTDSEFLNECVKRDDIYRVQTPQSFRLKELEFVINSLTDEELASYTDVASIFHNKGYNVRLVKGSDNNIKITTPFDLAVAQAIIANSN
ncbi:MAG: D-ribitol-5-phosphate cytidylyltransferase, partial [Clostridia bacterium]|nr:D-ribitol-5-phosphate cytidylyltransferase [Clostridia bacterium]